MLQSMEVGPRLFSSLTLYRDTNQTRLTSCAAIVIVWEASMTVIAQLQHLILIKS